MNKLKQTLYAVPIALATTFMAGCVSCEKENSPPEAKLEINPTKGEVPLEVRMKLTGIDPDGDKDISWYSLNVNNKEMKRRYPIDTTMTFANSGIVKVYGEVVDSKNQMGKTAVNSIEIYGKPFLETSLSLINDVNLKYSSILSRVDKATLNINRDGKLLSTQEINDINQSGIDYEKTFNYSSDGIIKGKYEFILKSENLEKKDTITVSNYKPTMGLIAAVNFKEEEKIKIKLPGRSDKNPEDNPVPITSAKSLDGKTQPTIYGDSLEVKGLPNKNGNYQLEIEFGNTTGGLEKAVMGGYITPDTRIKINPFIQPNDTTLNWYGSGDVNNDNIVNTQDVTRISEIIAGTYSNPNDRRLNDRADINGDGIVDNQDKQILENKLNGSIPYMPGEWNKLTTRAEREDWLKKMLAIDLTSEVNGWNCTQYGDQLYLNLYGFKSIGDISDLLEYYPNYDLSNNGRFNLPLYRVSIADYDSDGISRTGHAMNTIVLGDNALNWNDLCNVEPQTDQMNVQPGEAYLIGIDSKFYIGGSHGVRTRYIQYDIKNKIPIFIETNPDVKIITQRGK